MLPCNQPGFHEGHHGNKQIFRLLYTHMVQMEKSCPRGGRPAVSNTHYVTPVVTLCMFGGQHRWISTVQTWLRNLCVGVCVLLISVWVCSRWFETCTFGIWSDLCALWSDGPLLTAVSYSISDRTHSCFLLPVFYSNVRKTHAFSIFELLTSYCPCCSPQSLP